MPAACEIWHQGGFVWGMFGGGCIGALLGAALMAFMNELNN